MADILEQSSDAQIAAGSQLDHAAEMVTSDQQSLWSAIRDALRGTHRDYTEGLRIWKKQNGVWKIVLDVANVWPPAKEGD
jgi:hypothetical protein